MQAKKRAGIHLIIEVKETKIKWVKTLPRNVSMEVYRDKRILIQAYFLLNVKLRIDSSKMSVRQSLHEGLSVFADEDACEGMDDTDCAGEGTRAGGGTSTSTTLTTARPSRTLRTFSASQFLDAEEPWAGAPAKASQNALPSLLKSVWLAIAAAAACSFDGSIGEAGGVG